MENPADESSQAQKEADEGNDRKQAENGGGEAQGQTPSPKASEWRASPSFFSETESMTTGCDQRQETEIARGAEPDQGSGDPGSESRLQGIEAALKVEDVQREDGINGKAGIPGDESHDSKSEEVLAAAGTPMAGFLAEAEEGHILAETDAGGKRLRRPEPDGARKRRGAGRIAQPPRAISSEKTTAIAFEFGTADSRYRGEMVAGCWTQGGKLPGRGRAESRRRGRPPRAVSLRQRRSA